MHFTLRQLRVLLAIADKGSFGGAAQAIGLTQSAVSQCIRTLEEELGFRLVERTTRRVDLTPAGATLAGPLRANLLALDALLEQARSTAQAQHGEVRIACAPHVSSWLAPRCLADAALRFPSVRITLQEQAQDVAVQSVRDGTADFALAVAPEAARSDLVQTPVLSDHFVLVCRRDHPFARRKKIALPQLQLERLILLDAASGGRQALDRLLTAHGIPVRTALVVAHADTALGMVTGRLGVALIPALCLPLPHGAPLRALPLDPTAGRDIVLLSRRHPALSTAARGIHDLFVPSRPEAVEPQTARAITLLIPFPAGGPADRYGRAFAGALASHLQRAVTVRNTTGLGGTRGVHAVSRSLADGLTIGLAGNGATVFSPPVSRNGLLDVFKDLTILGGLVRVPTILVAGAHMPVRTLPELLAQARLRPLPYAIGMAGTGSSRVLAELLQSQAGIRLLAKPYDGLVQALEDLQRGRIDLLFGEPAGVLSSIDSGAARALLTAGDQRARWLPDVPSAAEAGLPGLATEGGYCLVGPAGLSPAVLEPLSRTIADVLRSPALVAELEAQGGSVDLRSGAYYATFLKHQQALWTDFIQAGSATPA